jgi:hypothetical protein
MRFIWNTIPAAPFDLASRILLALNATTQDLRSRNIRILDELIETASTQSGDRARISDEMGVYRSFALGALVAFGDF